MNESISFHVGEGNPNSVQFSSKGGVYVDSTNHDVYVKSTSSDMCTGWERFVREEDN